MNYLVKYNESFITRILYKIIGKFIDKANYEHDSQLLDIAKRFGDPKLTLPELVANGEPKAYNLLIRGYKHFYPKNSILEDCEFMLKQFQEDLWKNKDNYEVLSEAIFNLNKFIEYYKNTKLLNPLL